MEILDAIYKLDTVKIKQLLVKGNNPSMFVHGISLLHWAILKGSIPIVKQLIKYGAVVSEHDMSVGIMKHNPELELVLADSRKYDSINIPNSLIEGRTIRLRGEVDPITHTGFEFGDECVMIRGAYGPFRIDGDKWYVFKQDPFNVWFQQNNTNPLTREVIQVNDIRYFTYVNWYGD